MVKHITLVLSMILTFESNCQKLVLDKKLPADIASELADTRDGLMSDLQGYDVDSVKVKVDGDQILVIAFCKWDSTNWKNNIEAYSGITNMYDKMNYKYFSVMLPIEILKPLHYWVYRAYVRTTNTYLKDALKVVSFEKGGNKIVFFSDTKQVYFTYKKVDYSTINQSRNPAFFVLDKLENLDGSKNASYYLCEMLGLL